MATPSGKEGMGRAVIGLQQGFIPWGWACCCPGLNQGCSSKEDGAIALKIQIPRKESMGLAWVIVFESQYMIER